MLQAVWTAAASGTLCMLQEGRTAVNKHMVRPVLHSARAQAGRTVSEECLRVAGTSMSA